MQSFNENSCIRAQDRSWYVAKKVPFSLLDAFYPWSSQLWSSCKPEPTPPVALIFPQSCCPFSLLARVIIVIISGCPDQRSSPQDWLRLFWEGGWWNPCMQVSRWNDLRFEGWWDEISELPRHPWKWALLLETVGASSFQGLKLIAWETLRKADGQRSGNKGSPAWRLICETTSWLIDATIAQSRSAIKPPHTSLIRTYPTCCLCPIGKKSKCFLQQIIHTQLLDDQLHRFRCQGWGSCLPGQVGWIHFLKLDKSLSWQEAVAQETRTIPWNYPRAKSYQPESWWDQSRADMRRVPVSNILIPPQSPSRDRIYLYKDKGWLRLQIWFLCPPIKRLSEAPVYCVVMNWLIQPQSHWTPC